MRKALLIICIFSAFFAFYIGADAQSDIKITVDGKNVEFTDAVPYAVNGRVLVPMRALADAMESFVTWNEDTQGIYIVKVAGVSGDAQADEIVFANFTLNSSECTVGNSYGGVKMKMDAAPEAKDGRTYISARYVAYALGYDAKWDAESSTVVCTYTGKQDITFGISSEYPEEDITDIVSLSFNLLKHSSQKAVLTEKGEELLKNYGYGFETDDALNKMASTILYTLNCKNSIRAVSENPEEVYESIGGEVLNGKTDDEIKAIIKSDYLQIPGFINYSKQLRLMTRSDAENFSEYVNMEFLEDYLD